MQLVQVQGLVLTFKTLNWSGTDDVPVGPPLLVYPNDLHTQETRTS